MANEGIVSDLAFAALLPTPLLPVWCERALLRACSFRAVFFSPYCARSQKSTESFACWTKSHCSPHRNTLPLSASDLSLSLCPLDTINHSASSPSITTQWNITTHSRMVSTGFNFSQHSRIIHLVTMTDHVVYHDNAFHVFNHHKWSILSSNLQGLFRIPILKQYVKSLNFLISSIFCKFHYVSSWIY
uniref:Secreted protein n=1 Tax=Rodentolepis nana TaxID=102285 RepID=A0A0R3T761_RODNA